MKILARSVKLFFLFTSFFMASFTLAEGYIGIAYGNTDYGAQEDGSSYQISGGYSLNNIVSAQVSYIDYGDVNDNAPPIWRAEADAIEVAGIAKYELIHGINLIGIAGVSFWDLSLSEDGYGVIGVTDGSDLFYGIGLDLVASDKVSVIFEYKDYDISVQGVDISVDNISAGLKYQF